MVTLHHKKRTFIIKRYIHTTQMDRAASIRTTQSKNFDEENITKR